MNKLVNLISDCVRVFPNPAVYIGGGIDSAIILQHLKEKSDGEIFTYTFGFGDENDEFEHASKVSEYYSTKHSDVLIDELLPPFPHILSSMPWPRFSLWIYWLAEKAFQDERKTCYVGEGADEHFGGYWYKARRGYLENWVGILQWGIPTYLAIHKIFPLRFEAPFMHLDWRETLPYYDYEQHKIHLREAYKDIIPPFILHRKKQPATINYQKFWLRELKQHFPAIQNPISDSEIRELFQAWVSKEWLKLHTQ